MDGLASFTLVVLKAVCDLVAPGNHRKVAKRVVRALGLYIGIMACANRPARAKLVLQLRKVDSAANESEVLSIRKRGRGGEGRGEKRKKKGALFSPYCSFAQLGLEHASSRYTRVQPAARGNL